MDIEHTPDRPTAAAPVPPTGAHRPALDAGDLPALDADPACDDARADVASDGSFPASDPSSPAQPGTHNEPVPSSGFPAKPGA